MGVITELQTRVNNLKLETDINTIIYDRDEAINFDSKNSYPMVIYRVTGLSDSNFRNKKQHPELTVEFFISDLYFQGDTDTLAEKKDSLDYKLTQLINSIPDYGNPSDKIGRAHV